MVMMSARKAGGAWFSRPWRPIFRVSIFIYSAGSMPGLGCVNYVPSLYNLSRYIYIYTMHIDSVLKRNGPGEHKFDWKFDIY